MIFRVLCARAFDERASHAQEKPEIDAFETIMRHKEIITGKLGGSFCLLFSAVYEESGTARA
jgi:hypothetical protein